jgi:hypothetical protein
MRAVPGSNFATSVGLRLAAAVAALALSVLSSALPAWAEDDLTGTWRGTLNGNGGRQQVQLRFSEDGYRLFDYTNNRGAAQTVEWSAPGRVQYVPSGGGVTTVAVESVDKRPGAVTYMLHTGFERARNGYLTQQFTYEQHDYTSTNEGLWVRIIRQASSYLGDSGGSTGGPGKEEVLEGILARVD